MENIRERIQNAKNIFSYCKGSLSQYANSGMINVVLADDLIYKKIDDVIINYIDKDKTKKVFDYINLYLETIIELSEKEKTLPHYKDTSKDEIIININDKNYRISRKVDSKEIVQFYDKIVAEILEIIK